MPQECASRVRSEAMELAHTILPVASFAVLAMNNRRRFARERHHKQQNAVQRGATVPSALAIICELQCKESRLRVL